MEMIFALAISFVVSAAVGRVLIPMLRRFKAGQSIREDGPTWHNSKSGTPTMGGIMFIAGIFVALLTAGFPAMKEGTYTHLYVFAFALIFGIIGFADDYVKVKYHRNLGLTALQKFLLQLAAAVAFISLLRFEGALTPNLYVPFLNRSYALSWPLYTVFSAFVIVGTVNAVNLTDGLDGLAGTVSVPVTLFFCVAAIWWKYAALGTFSAALLGGLLAFLMYNFYPAKVFMGDTGSLFLGGAVAALAFAFDMPLILILVGIVYICETLSDIIQVIYFKATHGKRFFKMAPLHHHFEMCGWKEVQIVALFSAVSLAFCALALFGITDRFVF